MSGSLGVWQYVTCRVKSSIRLSPVLQLWLLHTGWPKSQVLSERHKRQKLHAASSSGSWRWRSKRRGGGLLWQHPCWWRGCREWEGNLYNYNHFIFFWVGGWRSGRRMVLVVVGGQAPLDARCLAARCIKSIPLHLTPRPSYSLCDIENEEGAIFCVSSASHVSSDWQQLQCFMESLPWLKGCFLFFFVLLVSETQAEYRDDDLHNEKLSEDVIPFNDCHF